MCALLAIFLMLLLLMLNFGAPFSSAKRSKLVVRNEMQRVHAVQHYHLILTQRRANDYS